MIFKYIDRKELGDHLFLCKKWHPVLISLYYESITWRSVDKIQQLKQQLAPVNENNNNMCIFQRLPITKRLCIHDEADYGSERNGLTRFTEREFLYILSLFPNLKCLDIHESVNRKYYIEILCNFQSTEILQFLEEIIMKTDYMNDYDDEPTPANTLSAHYHFRQSLKSMNVFYTDDSIHGKSFMESLIGFKNLSVLEILNTTNPDLTLFNLLQACPHLSSLKYDSTLPVPESSSQQLANMLDQNSSTPNFLSSLKILKLSLSSLTTPYIEFFTNYRRPKNLEQVDIHLKEVYLNKWLNDVSLAAALELCRTLRKMSSINLKFGQDGDDLHGQADSFYRILGTLTTGRKFRNRMFVQKYCNEFDEFSEEEDTNKGVEIAISGSELMYEHCFELLDEYMEDDFDINPPNFTLPPCSSLQFLELDRFESYRVYDEEEFDIIVKLYLEFMKRYMPKVTQIRLRSLEDQCVETIYANQTLENTTHLRVNCYPYSTKEMKYLHNYFPRLQGLEFLLCSPKRRPPTNANATFRLAGLNNLHTVIIETSYDMDYFQSRLVFLQHTDSRHLTTTYLLKSSHLTTTFLLKSKGIEGANYLQRISPFYMKERLDDAKEPTFTIYLEGPIHLKNIILKHNSALFAQLTLKPFMSLF